MKDYRRLPVQDSFELPAAVAPGDTRYTAGTTPYTEDLGIAVRGDDGLLFGMACTAWAASFVSTWLHQQSIPYITRLDD